MYDTVYIFDRLETTMQIAYVTLHDFEFGDMIKFWNIISTSARKIIQYSHVITMIQQYFYKIWTNESAAACHQYFFFHFSFYWIIYSLNIFRSVYPNEQISQQN